MEEALGLCEATEASVNPTGKSGARSISRVISVEALGSSNTDQQMSESGYFRLGIIIMYDA